MKYDFETVLDRSDCGSMKWNAAPGASVENVPLSTADMEFPTAPPIVKAIKDVADKRVLGYTGPTDEFYDAVCGWMERRHNFHVEKEWIINTPGVVNALGLLIEAVTKPGDSLIMLTPIYYPFDMAALAKGRGILYSTLINRDGRYEIDFKDLEAKAKNPRAKAILFCSPHNPVGRVWTAEELRKVAGICIANGVFIIDDEIHHDLIMPGYEHTVMANVSKSVLNNIAVCTAPSKTFNLAGLQCSNIIIPNDKVRTKAKACALLDMQKMLNIFAYTACTAAYNECEDWFDELLRVIEKNAKTVESFMAKNFPEVKVSPLEGTYLQWIDVRGLGLTHVEMKKALEDAGIYFDNGEMFGIAGRGFQRINLACSEKTIKAMLGRFKKAIEKVREDWEKNGRPYHRTLVEGEEIENFSYISASGEEREFRDAVTKPTLLVFARFADCEITKILLGLLKAAYPLFKLKGCDIKAVINSPAEQVRPLQNGCSFELIADGDAALYERFNVFEADDGIKMVAGDRLFEKFVHGNVKKLLDSDLFGKLAGSFLDEPKEEEGPKKRDNQLCAFFVIDDDLEIEYAHYSKTIADFPNVVELLKKMKK